MKCPKCQYIGFESGDRCRNCGYEFSLAPGDETLDLPIQTGDEPLGPLADFSLADPAPSVPGESLPRPDGGNGARPAMRPITGAFDLPLFRGPHDDAPLVTPPAVPRAPLAVRRASPAIARPRARQDPSGTSEPELPGLHQIAGPAARPAPGREVEPVADAPAETESTPSGVLARVAALVVDALFLGSINLTVLHFTLQLTRLGFDEALRLPLIPFGAFLLLLNGSYLVVFTAAGGQTIGKMVMRLRVVPANPVPGATRVPLGHAVVRAAGCLVTLLTAGLGYLPALGGQRRALHDRLADTRVIRA